MQQATVSTISETVKRYFEKIKAADVKFAERPLIDWMDFNIISVKEENGSFVVKCEFNETLFSSKKVRYTVKVNKEGEIIEVVKEND